jgi:hypothetical protein
MLAHPPPRSKQGKRRVKITASLLSNSFISKLWKKNLRASFHASGQLLLSV